MGGRTASNIPTRYTQPHHRTPANSDSSDFARAALQLSKAVVILQYRCKPVVRNIHEVFEQFLPQNLMDIAQSML
jgi:hypothetical protein